MFEAVELGRKVDKESYERAVFPLRLELLEAQRALRAADFPLILLVAGDDRKGVNGLLNRLNEWLDARYVRTRFFGPPTEEQLERPRFWRYWRACPADGQMGIVVGAWAAAAIGERARGELDEAAFLHRCEQIQHLERTLVEDGALLLKLWLHRPRKGKGRKGRAKGRDGERGWRVDEADWRLYEDGGEALEIAEGYLGRTNTPAAPWILVESTDERYRDLTVGRQLLEALRGRLDRPPPPLREPASAPLVPAGPSVLDAVDLEVGLSREDYDEALERCAARLSRLTRKARRKGVTSVLVFEGWDAAGKGGAIRRLTRAMDVQDYQVVPIAAPSEEELRHHYLWRFWRHLPRAGRVLIFDRSWYGRVLVERVEGFTPERVWRRAYAEIVDFEEQLVERGCALSKFWLHIDRDEQLRRFEEREETPHKQHKISAEDYRNREKWEAYERAVTDMVAQTSTPDAPWHLVAANDKRWARIRVIELFLEALERRL